MSYWRLLFPNLPLNCIPDALSRPLFTCSLDANHYIVEPHYQITMMKMKSHSFTTANASSRFHCAGILQFGGNAGALTQKSQVSASLSWNYTFDDEDLVDSAFDNSESLYLEDDTESERRRKIGLANKGKAPWNKGKKHSPETRALISKRTREALKEPKVREKMCGGRSHSEEVKAKIGLAQRRVWRKRLKLKYEKEKIYWIWAESIAEAAKKGWCDQEELEWDSFEKLTSEIALQQLQLTTDEERAKKLAKLKARREKAEKKAKRALQKTEKAKKAESREAKKKRCRETKKENQEIPTRRGLKLKARITKIRQMKSVDGQVTITGDVTTTSQPAIETLDLKLIETEKLRRELSLAEQIQVAKKKRIRSARKEVMRKTSSSFTLKGRVEQFDPAEYKDESLVRWQCPPFAKN